MALMLEAGCTKDKTPVNDYTITPYNLIIPQGFPPMPIPAYNPTSVEGVALGRKLYYDPILSMNERSCSSFSVPIIGPTGNNVLPHINLGWKSNYLWFGGEHQLDHIPLADLAEGNVFLNTNNDTLLERLKNHPQYPELFEKAFGIDITEVSMQDRHHYISYALAQFLRTLISANSRFDQYTRHELQLTPNEINGYIIFNTEKGDCFHCHGSALFTDNEPRNNGLDSIFTGTNQGRYIVTTDSNDLGKFISPTLRNIELTAPYMHDARFATLEEVVEFYNSGVKRSPTVDPIMTKPGKEYGLQLTQQEKDDLVAFLKTLTDTSYITNPAFTNPN
jgi:cytochrome c peroxidase